MFSDFALACDVDKEGIVHIGRVDDGSFFYTDKLEDTVTRRVDYVLESSPSSVNQPFESKDVRDFLHHAPDIDAYTLVDAFKNNGTSALFLEVLGPDIPRPLEEYIELLLSFEQGKKYFNKVIENFTTIKAVEFIATNGIGFHTDDLFSINYGGQSAYSIFICIQNDYNYKFLTNSVEFTPKKGDVFLFNQNLEHAVIPTSNQAINSEAMIYFLAYTEIFDMASPSHSSGTISLK